MIDFTSFSNFIIDSGLALWNFMLSNLLTASILVVLILLPKLYRLFSKFVTGR